MKNTKNNLHKQKVLKGEQKNMGKQCIYTVEANSLTELESKLDRMIKQANNDLGYKVISVQYHTRPNYSAMILCSTV